MTLCFMIENRKEVCKPNGKSVGKLLYLSFSKYDLEFGH